MYEHNPVRLTDFARAKGLSERTATEMAKDGRLAGAFRKEGSSVWYVHPEAFVVEPPPSGQRARAEVMGHTLQHPKIPLARFGMRGRPVIITTYNYAGGSGKTTLARDMSVLLAAAGYRVLLLDTDPQASLTRWISREVEPPGVDLEPTIYATYASNDLQPRLPEPIMLDEKLHFVPSTTELNGLEMLLTNDQHRLANLYDALVATGGQYDVVIADSPPSLGQITVGNVVASDYAVIPVEGASKGLEGITKLVNHLQELQIKKNRILRKPQGSFVKIAALVPTRVVSRLSLTEKIMKALEAMSGNLEAPLSPVLTARDSAYNLATAKRTPIPLLPRRNGSVREAADEVREVVAFITGNIIESEKGVLDVNQ